MARVLLFGSYSQSLITFRGQLMHDIRRRGHTVYACAPLASDSIKKKLYQWNIHYRHVALQRTGLNPIIDLFHLYRLVKLFRSIRPDVILTYSIKPVIYGSIAASLASIPSRNVMITGRGYVFYNDFFLQRLLNIIIKPIYKTALSKNEVVFFHNPDDLEFFSKNGLLSNKNKLVIVNGSGVDLDHFKPSPHPKETSFLMIARLIREKGVREYVQAAREIKMYFPRTRFHLVGFIDNTPGAILSQELKNWNKEGVIKYWGRLDDVRPAIRECSVYVLPSYCEGMPRTILEAMAMGRPIITTDAPGCRQTVEPGRNGLIVPVKCVPSLINAMQYFIDEPNAITSMGFQSQLIANDRYDVHKINAVMLRKLGLD